MFDEFDDKQFSASQNLSLSGIFEVLQAKGRSLTSTFLLSKLGSSNTLLLLLLDFPIL